MISDSDVVPFPGPIKISCFTKKKGPLTKIIRLDPETKQVVKDGTECSMFSGTVHTIEISSPAGFARMIRSRKSNQAIAHGTPEFKEATIVTKGKEKPEKQVISRSEGFFTYPSGPGVLLFDHDKARPGSTGSEAALKAYRPQELIELLATVHPGIKEASFVSTPSTSSCIYDSEGNELRGEGTGSHVYLFVKNAADIPRYLKTLGKRLFLAGLGRIEISKPGALLPRTLVDLVVGSPERLDFVAGAVCEDGLIQKLPDPVVKNGEMLDTCELLDLTPAEVAGHKVAVDALKAEAKPAQEKVVSEYLEQESAKLAIATCVSIDEAKAVIVSRQDHILADDDILYFSHLKNGSKVADVLLNGADYHGKSLADPLEPDYEGGSKTKAIFYWNDGIKPVIHSFAHGGMNFRFRRDVSEGSGGDYFPEHTLQALQKMNSEYAAVLIGGDFRIAKEGFDDTQKKHTLSFLKSTSLFSYFSNTKVQVPVGDKGDFESKEIAKVWMTWRERRTYDDVIFDPSKYPRPGAYNLFKGFPLKPRQGDWGLMRNHILQIICNGVVEHFEYIMAWMARAVQDPGGDKPGVAIVMKGGKGIGKGVFVNYFGAIFGEAFLPIADSEGFTGKFNMHLSKSLLVFLDEAVWGGDKKAEGKLKQLITEPMVMFEPKGIDSIALANHMNIIIASNEEWVIPATGDERRFCVLEPSEEFKQDTQYFGKILHEKRNGGPEAMMYDLLQHDYSAVDLRKAPITNGLSQQVQESLPSVLDFWYSVLSRGYILSNKETGQPVKSEAMQEMGDIPNDRWPGLIFKWEIYKEYINWCNERKERYVDSDGSFWKWTWRIWPGGRPKRIQKKEGTGKVIDAIVLPLRKDIIRDFTEKTKIYLEDCENDQEEKTCTPFLPFEDNF